MKVVGFVLVQMNRKWNNRFMTEDNTKKTLTKFLKYLIQHCIERLVNINSVNRWSQAIMDLELHSNGVQPCYHPLRLIPSTIPSDDLNISTFGGCTVSVCRSMKYYIF